MELANFNNKKRNISPQNNNNNKKIKYESYKEDNEYISYHRPRAYAFSLDLKNVNYDEVIKYINYKSI